MLIWLIIFLCDYVFSQNATLPSIDGFVWGDYYEDVLEQVKNRGYLYQFKNDTENMYIIIPRHNLLTERVFDDGLFESVLVFRKSDKRLIRIASLITPEGKREFYSFARKNRNSIYTDHSLFLIFSNQRYWDVLISILGKEHLVVGGDSSGKKSYAQQAFWNYNNGRVIFQRIWEIDAKRYYSVDFNMFIEIFDLPILPKSSSIHQIKPKQEQDSQGSGIILSVKDGIIVTNYHVVENAKSIRVKVNGATVSARVLMSDKNNDLALLEIAPSYLSNMQSIPFSLDYTQKEVGESVYTLGYPLSSALGDEIKLTDGIISSRTGYQGDVSTYQISAPIQPGSSGGALFDMKGNLVGITNAGVSSAQNVGYAIKTGYLKNLIDSSPHFIDLPKTNRLAGLNLQSQVKMISPYVVIVISTL